MRPGRSRRLLRRVCLRVALPSTALALAATACGAGGTTPSQGSGDGAQAGPVQTFVSIPPQRYFVQRIGGRHVDVSVVLPPSGSPALYEPSPSDLRALSDADVYFAIDVPFERSRADRIQAAGGDEMQWVPTWRGIDRGQPSSGKPDPHIWQSPRRVTVQAQTIATTLARADPAHAQDYRRNLRQFRSQVDELDTDIQRRLAPYRGQAFMSFHPAWNYYAQDYGLELLPIEEGGKEPSAAELQDTIAQANRRTIQVVFVQPQFSTNDARAIADQVGARVQRLDPLAPNWAQNLRTVTTSLVQAFQQRGSP